MEAIEHLPHHAQLELFLYVLKKTVFLFILLEIFAGWTNARHRRKTHSAASGNGSVLGKRKH